MRLRLRKYRQFGYAGFIVAIFAVSVLPFALALFNAPPEVERARSAQRAALPLLGPFFARVEGWYGMYAAPVQELRQPASFPSAWTGSWMETDKNYALFEKWFADHLGLRSLMIRAKNEVDYALFRSSSRVYFGKHGELFGRSVTDIELPTTELVLDTPAKIDAVYRGVLRYAARLKARGVTMVLVAPVQKQYFRRDHLPFFAPRQPDDSHFMQLYRRLRDTPALHMVDVVGLLQRQQHVFPIFFQQDFHWTDPMAQVVAQETVKLIARLEGQSGHWQYPAQIEYRPLQGSEARFSARLNAHEEVREPFLQKTWQDRHASTELDAEKTGLEFDTDTLDDPSLLPATCMYGNSFGDGMLRAGLADHFQKFSKINRAMPLPSVPALVRGRCRYLIMQVLDIQGMHWRLLSL
ncbi:MAG: hypothetical protein V4724_26185 [Pseudomonadota bacterium]